MALPYTAADITELKAQCQAFADICTLLGDALMNAGNDTTWPLARMHLLDAAGICYYGRDQWKTTTFINCNSQLAKMFTGIRANWPSGTATLTMGNVLTAMLTAKYSELQKFVGIEDAYRSAIWDQPFNSEFYAALARGFMPWV